MKYKLLFLVMGTFLLVACASKSVTVEMKAAPYLNPDERQKSLPVEVQLYQLKNPENFQHASFQSLWKSGSAALGNSLQASQKVMVNPDSQKKISLDRAKEAKYIGAVAIFRTPYHGHWRVLAPMPSGFLFMPGLWRLQLKDSEIRDVS